MSKVKLPDLDSWSEIKELNEELNAAVLDLKNKRAAATAARTHVDDLTERLKQAIEEANSDQPRLPFGQSDDDEGGRPTIARGFDEEEPDPDLVPDENDTSWRRVPVSYLKSCDLAESIAEKLEEAQLWTIGHLTDWQKEDKKIKGLAGQKLGKLADAMEEFWRRWNRGEITPPAEPEARGQARPPEDDDDETSED